MSLITTVVLCAAAVLLGIAAVVAVTRIAAGPTQLDRSIAADLIVAVTVAAVGLWMVWTDLSTELVLLVLLSLVGFTGAVGVARLVSDRLATQRRYYTQADEEDE